MSARTFNHDDDSSDRSLVYTNKLPEKAGSMVKLAVMVFVWYASAIISVTSR